jgi:hypothetical protein
LCQSILLLCPTVLLHRADIQALQWFGSKPNLGMDFTRAEEKEHLERGAVGCKTRRHYELKKMKGFC